MVQNASRRCFASKFFFPSIIDPGFFFHKISGEISGENPLSGFGDNLQPGGDTAPRLEARESVNRCVHDNGRPLGRLVAGEAWDSWQEIPGTMHREKGSATVEPLHQPSEDAARRTSEGSPRPMHNGIRGGISSGIHDDSYAASHSISHQICLWKCHGILRQKTQGKLRPRKKTPIGAYYKDPYRA